MLIQTTGLNILLDPVWSKQLQANNAVANERILAPLSPRERELLLDFLVRVIQANAIYARPGAGRRRRGSRPMPRERG
jgi:hypothetical protein